MSNQSHGVTDNSVANSEALEKGLTNAVDKVLSPSLSHLEKLLTDYGQIISNNSGDGTSNSILIKWVAENGATLLIGIGLLIGAVSFYKFLNSTPNQNIGKDLDSTKQKVDSIEEKVVKIQDTTAETSCEVTKLGTEVSNVNVEIKEFKEFLTHLDKSKAKIDENITIVDDTIKDLKSATVDIANLSSLIKNSQNTVASSSATGEAINKFLGSLPSFATAFLNKDIDAIPKILEEITGQTFVPIAQLNSDSGNKDDLPPVSPSTTGKNVSNKDSYELDNLFPPVPKENLIRILNKKWKKKIEPESYSSSLAKLLELSNPIDNSLDQSQLEDDQTEDNLFAKRSSQPRFSEEIGGIANSAATSDHVLNTKLDGSELSSGIRRSNTAPFTIDRNPHADFSDSFNENDDADFSHSFSAVNSPVRTPIEREEKRV